MPDYEPLSQVGQGRVLIQNAQYDEGIVQRTLELIERSHALLEETKHQVERSCALLKGTGSLAATSRSS